MGNFFTFRYWFNLDPSQFIYLGQVILVSFLILVFITGVFFMFYKNKTGPYKILYNKLYNFCFVNLFLGILLFFFDYQGVYFFSARFWFLLWLAFMIAWIIGIIKNFNNLLSTREERKKQQELKKYLP